MRKKERREGRLIRGDELLEARGIDLDGPDETLLPALTAAIGADPDSDLSIADLLGSIALEEAAHRLLEWDRRGPTDKDLKRVIRGALFRLQQRGIAAAARHEDPGAPVRIIEPVEPAGYLSPLDGAGTRLAWITRPRPEGGQLVLSSLIGDRTGMQQLDVLVANKSRIREILADAAKHSVPLVPAPHRYVDWLMSQAYKRGAPRDEHGGGYMLMRAEVYDSPAVPVEPPVDPSIARMTEEEAERLRDESARLFEEPEFRGWALPDDLTKVHQARFKDAQDTTLVLSKDQMTDRLTRVIDEAFEEIFETTHRALYAARMLEMALWYAFAGRPAPARMCHAVWLAMNDPGRRLKGISFLKVLAFRSFAPHLPDQPAPEGEPETQAPSLIVRPR